MQSDLIPIGIDIGSTTSKAVVFNGAGGFFLATSQSADTSEISASTVATAVLAKAGLPFNDKLYTVTTGAGGKAVPFSRQQKAITTCLARGITHLLPSVRMAIDIGAETLTVIKINERGRLADWGNQDKCAAGTGIFLQQMAKLMQMSIEEMSVRSLEAKAKADISSTCAVFAESEVISHIHRVPPTPKEEIIAGVYLSMVNRILVLCKRIGIEQDIAVTGGVALNRGLVKILEEALGCTVLVPPDPQSMAALGAAILAREQIEKG